MAERIHDVVGIGIGPFNLGLACLLDPVEGLDCLFIERQATVNWHGGTLLQDATLQTPFLCDLVSLADPTSRFSLLNFLKESGQIYSFYAFLLDTANFFLPRNAFNAYYRWAASKLENLVFNADVTTVSRDANAGCYLVTWRDTRSGEQTTARAHKLVLGTGMVPNVPETCRGIAIHAVHSAAYLENRAKLRERRAITVIGSGQSASEVFYDLLTDIDKHHYSLRWVTRSPRLIPRELTKQTLQMTTPDYSDYFFSLPFDKRAELIDMLKAVYQGINPSLINDIFDLRYRKQLTGNVDVELIANTQVVASSYEEANGHFNLEFEQVETGERFSHTADGLVLGTGYHWPKRTYLDGISDRIKWTGQGARFAVARNCSIDVAGDEIFVSNAEIHPDAFIPPDLGQAAYRNSIIIAELTGREVYKVEKSTAFQTFRPNHDNTTFQDQSRSTSFNGRSQGTASRDLDYFKATTGEQSIGGVNQHDPAA